VFRKKAYLDSLSKNLNELIEDLNLADLQKYFLRLRWLNQVLWMEERANETKVLYYILRLTTIVGGVIIPALVIVNLRYGETTLSTWLVFGVSLLVAISAALDGFLRYGEQWRHYRLRVELLKNEGWLFFQLAGRHYHKFNDYETAYPTFARRVEKWNRLEVADFMTEVSQEKTEDEEDDLPADKNDDPSSRRHAADKEERQS
jgi:hypothetical protein